MTKEQQEQYVQHVDTIALELTRCVSAGKSLIHHDAVWGQFVQFREELMLLRAEENQQEAMAE